MKPFSGDSPAALGAQVEAGGEEDPVEKALPVSFLLSASLPCSGLQGPSEGCVDTLPREPLHTHTSPRAQGVVSLARE